MAIAHRNLPRRSRTASAAIGAVLVATLATRAHATSYYVRQTVGDDAHDGRTPDTAWLHPSRLSAVMEAGDTAFVGPGLYREGIDLLHGGTAEKRITLVADSTGQHTGDPPGVVMLAGSEPVDEAIFAAEGAPGVHRASFPFLVRGVVEMDGPQFRYVRASQTREHQADKLPEADVVRQRRGSYLFDESSRVLLLHTSDDQPPSRHEIELIVRDNGVAAVGRRAVTVAGFTFRHFQDAGVNLYLGSDGGVVTGTTVYGSRQGVRVHGSQDVLVHGNTFFRNENSGAYFVAGSTRGRAVENVGYENVKGLRWGSGSDSGQAVDNSLFENLDGGISLEESRGAELRGNRLVDNGLSQLIVRHAGFGSEDNCFEAHGSGQLVADFHPFPVGAHYASLLDYRSAQRQDLRSTEGSCGQRPRKLDVHALHAATQAYAGRARQILSRPRIGGDGTRSPASPALAPAARLRQALSWLLGR